jgi:hypothetical protein
MHRVLARPSLTPVRQHCRFLPRVSGVSVLSAGGALGGTGPIPSGRFDFEDGPFEPPRALTTTATKLKVIARLSTKGRRSA